MTTEPEYAQPETTVTETEPVEGSRPIEVPAVLDWGGARRVFGRGVNDINEWNDPC